MDDVTKSYFYCIVALRKIALDIEGNCRVHYTFRKVAGNIRIDTPEEDMQIEQNVRYFSRALLKGLSPEQKKIYKEHFHQL